MPAGREGRCDAPFSFALPPLNLHGGRGLGGVGFGGSLVSAAALLECACQRVERASRFKLVFALESFNFPGPGAVLSGGSLHQTAALLVDTCERDGRGRAINFFCCASAVYFSQSGGARGRSFRWNSTGGGGGAFGIYMTACR